MSYTPVPDPIGVTQEGPFTVTVSNLPATQAVSGPLTDAQLRAAAVPVSVGNFPTTQAVSGPLTDTQLRASAVPVRLTSDTARTNVVLHASAVASVTSEALVSLTGFKGGAAVAAATSYTVTAGKTFRLQALRFRANFATMNATATFANVSLRLRVAASGTLATSSPLVLAARLDAASNAAGPDLELPIPDGLEFPAGSVIGVSQLGSAATLVCDVTLIGFEY